MTLFSPRNTEPPARTVSRMSWISPARSVCAVLTHLLVAAIIAFVAGVVSLAAIRSRDFARAAPGAQEGPRK
jgi:hypothetical protein